MRSRLGYALALIAAVSLPLLVSACGFGADQPTGRLGETLTAGDYQVIATGLENPADRPDRFTNPKAGNRFVKLHVTVTNTGSQHLPVASNYFSLKDSGGTDNPAMAGVPSDTGLKATSVGPGQHLDTDLYFEMAGNVSPTQLIFAPIVVGWRTRVTFNL